MPRMRLWKSRSPDGTPRSPLGLREHELGLLDVLGEDDLDLPVDVLLDHVRALRTSRLVPAQRPDHRLDLVAAQPVHEALLAFALLGAPHALDRSRDDLPGRVGVGLVLGRRVAELVAVLLDELDVAL